MINFGGGSQKSESSSQPVKQKIMSPYQRVIFKGPMYERIKEGVGEAPPAYPLAMSVPRTPEEQQYITAATTGEYPGYMQPRVAALNQVLSGQPAYEITPETTEALYKSSIYDPMMRYFNTEYMPALKEEFVGPGYYGSRRLEEQARARENLGYELANQYAQLRYQDELARRQALESAAGRQAQYALPAMQEGAQQLLQAANMSVSSQERDIYANFARWMMGEEVEGVEPIQNNPFWQLAFQYVGQPYYQFGQQSQSSSSGSNFGFGISL